MGGIYGDFFNFYLCAISLKLSETVDRSTPHLSEALRGVADLSDVIGKRDDQFTKLLAGANELGNWPARHRISRKHCSCC